MNSSDGNVSYRNDIDARQQNMMTTEIDDSEQNVILNRDAHEVSDKLEHLRNKAQEHIKNGKLKIREDNASQSLTFIGEESYVANRSPHNIRLDADKEPTWFYEFFVRSYRISVPFVVSVLMCIFFGSALIVLGVFLKQKQDQIEEISMPYHSYCRGTFPGSCDIPIEVKNDLYSKEIYLYLKISNMPQAVKEFTEQYSIGQLFNENPSARELFRDCGSKTKINQLNYHSARFDYNATEYAVPCGYLPNMFPSDDFIVLESFSDKNSYLLVYEANIVSEYTRNYSVTPTTSAVNIARPQFSNWMVV